MQVRRSVISVFRRILKRLHLYESRKSFALDGLDVKLEPFLNFRNGFFVEAGANDGIRQSNTLYFEKYMGWSGLLIEPVPELAENCRINRPDCVVENCALVSSEYQDESVEIRYCDLMSVVKGALGPDEEAHVMRGRKASNVDEYLIEVPARTLDSLLRKNSIGKIDLLSLDLEGYELKALKGLDLTRHHPNYILIEVRPRNEQEILEYLEPLYSPLAKLSEYPDRWDMLFIYNDV